MECSDRVQCQSSDPADRESSDHEAAKSRERSSCNSGAGNFGALEEARVRFWQ
jgi:hypothetical protein